MVTFRNNSNNNNRRIILEETIEILNPIMIDRNLVQIFPMVIILKESLQVETITTHQN